MDLAKLFQLANNYRAACADMRPLWGELLATEPDTPERSRQVKKHREARLRVITAKDELITYILGGHSETGA